MINSRRAAESHRRPRWIRRVVLIGVTLLGIALTGCMSRFVAAAIVRAPNQQFKMGFGPDFFDRFEETYSHSFMVPVGPPRAELAVAVLEPGNHGFNYQIRQDEGARSNRFRIDADWNTSPEGAAVAPKATVVVLHGVMLCKEMMMHWALYFAERGYRAVLVDLRGHGRSSGDWITYGAVESADLVQVLNDLEKRDLIAGSVGVLGTSYGAAVAFHWAAKDPRIEGLIAVQPFSHPHTAIVGFTRGAFKDLGEKISDREFRDAIARAAKIGRFSWADADVVQSASRLGYPVLIFHGENDSWIPPEQSIRLREAAPEGSRLRLLAGETHETLQVRLDPLAREAAEWFDKRLSGLPVPR